MCVFLWVRAEIPRVHFVPADLQPIQVFHPRNFGDGLSHRARRAQLLNLLLFAEHGWELLLLLLCDSLHHAFFERVDLALGVDVHLTLCVQIFVIWQLHMIFFFLFLLFIMWNLAFQR